uniref:Diacetylspermine oxidase n=1 Tax=Debaryomyces hansenii TaxID=4959 RepID=A9E360_DEBHN|nr:diacetylspermine oxidase [Debaryomyces hansenii]
MSQPIEVDACIVGGGVSGLKAFHTLLHHSQSKFNAENLVLVEAQNRLGGRIHTDHKSSKLGLSYDLGAAWFHDSLTNVVLKESIEDKSFNVSKDGYYDDKDIKVYASDSEKPLEINQAKLHRVAEDIEKFIELYFFEELDKEDIALCEIVEIFKAKYDDRLTEDQKRYCGLMLRYLELWYGITWDKISSKFAIMAHQGRNLYNKKGYDFVINKLLSKIPSDRVLLDHAVTFIDRNNKGHGKRVLVECANGQQIFCNYLVVTVPQSILALSPDSSHGITWTPPLPKNVCEALSKIHFGALGKVIFEFDAIWWSESEDRFEILADQVPNNSSLSAPLKGPPEKFTFPTFAINYSAMHGSSKASLALLTQSPLTEYVESHPEKAWSYFKPMLSKLAIDNKHVSDPINTITSNWTNNPYIRGSYTAVHTGDDPLDLITQLSGEHGCGLSEKNIRFAGEHTTIDGSGCVHGAYMSGEREALWVLKDTGAISG